MLSNTCWDKFVTSLWNNENHQSRLFSGSYSRWNNLASKIWQWLLNADMLPPFNIFILTSYIFVVASLQQNARVALPLYYHPWGPVLWLCSQNCPFGTVCEKLVSCLQYEITFDRIQKSYLTKKYFKMAHEPSFLMPLIKCYLLIWYIFQT